MNRLNFEEDDHELIDDVADAEIVMDASMGFLWDIIIEPNQDELDEDELNMLGAVGMALKLIAKKAKAYELMFEQGESNENSLN
jgi:hypothetical protein|tara:strand:+ start:70 stop:321 length:252 start_codon:yes stop_codon:yes gene_type:complete